MKKMKYFVVKRHSDGRVSKEFYGTAKEVLISVVELLRNRNNNYSTEVCVYQPKHINKLMIAELLTRGQGELKLSETTAKFYINKLKDTDQAFEMGKEYAMISDLYLTHGYTKLLEYIENLKERSTLQETLSTLYTSLN